jgi:SAM-dependent methyltransferase
MQTQHYRGLIAEWYDDWLGTRTDDIDYYTHYFHGFEGQILELACGTGRVLLPIAQQGGKIHGLDASDDMLAVLRKKASEFKLGDITLYCQVLEDFSLPAVYDAIFIAGGSFQLLTFREQAIKALSNIRTHLSRGGFFLADIFVPWDAILAPRQSGYQTTRDVVRGDGRRSLVLERLEIDIVQQVKCGTYRYEFYGADKQLQCCITDDLSIRWYWRDEFANLLREVGYSKVIEIADASLARPGYSFVFQAFK